MYRVETHTSKASYDWLEFALITVCRRAFPAEAALQIRSLSPRVNRVFPHIDYDFTLDVGDTEFNLILRMHQGFFSIWSGTEKFKIAKEYAIMRHAYEQGYPAPFPYISDISDQPFGCPYLILDPGDGYRWWENQESLRMVQHECVESMADELAKLHLTISPLHSMLPRVDVFTVMQQLEQRTLRLKNDELHRCFAGCHNQLKDLAGLSTVLLHGCFDVDNILVKNGRVRNVINWEHAALGDPRWDVAYTSTSLQRGDDRSLVNRFLSRYIEQTGLPTDDLNFWEGVVALRSFALSQWLRSIDPKSFEAIVGVQTPLFDQESDYRKRALKQFG